MTSPYKSQSQKHFNKNSAQKGRDDSLGASQQGKYYQSRYIYQQSPAESVQTLQTPFQKRSGQKNIQQQSQILPPKTQIDPQQQQFDINDQIALQTPIQSQYAHNRARSDYQQNQPNEMDLQIDIIIEQLLSDDIVLQSLNSQYRTPGGDKLKTGNKLREAIGNVLQQISARSGQSSQYSQLKNEYIKLQQDFQRKIGEQAERIQILQNQVIEKEDMLIREQKTRLMLENQNQEYCRKINDLTGDYHNKLQMKEEVFYQKGQECYNEINVLKRTIMELQQKIVDSESFMQHQEAEILKIQDKSHFMIEEKDGMLSQVKTEAFQARKHLEKTEIHNQSLNQQIEELRQQLQQTEISRLAIENNLRAVVEEKKKEQESYELLLKQKEAEKCLEANDLIQALNHLRDERIADNMKHKQWINAIQSQLKQLNQKKYDLMQLLYNQKNQWQGLVNVTVAKMSDTIKSNAIWYRRMLKDRDIAIQKFRREKEKEINDLNQRWQDVIESQDKTLHNEFQTEILSQSGKFEQKMLILQGQVNDYGANYMQIREHKDILQLKEAKWTEERDKLLKVIGELESIAEDLEWKLQKSEKEIVLSNEELGKEIQKKGEIILKFNDLEKRKLLVDAKLRNQEFLNNKFQNDVQDLLSTLDAQIGKNEKDLEIKKKLEEQLLFRRSEIQALDEEIVQRKFQIQQDNNLINKQQLLLEQKDKELQQKENEISRLKLIIDSQDQRIRAMELNERNDLNEYLKNSKANSEEIQQLWKAKKDLWKDLQDCDYEHMKGFDRLHSQKKKVVEELFGVTWQLRQRDRELKNEQRTVESLLANKRKLTQIIEDLNLKIEELNDKIEELQLNLGNVKEEKNKIIQKFKEFRLSQLRQKKFQLVQTKKFMQDLQKEYMNFGFQIGQEIKQSNDELSNFVINIEANLQKYSTQHEDEMNQLRYSLERQHEDDLNNKLYNEKERSRVELDTVKQQMGQQIIQLSEQLKILNKKLSHTGFNNNQLDIELNQSQNVMRVADQEIFDVKQRYKSIQGELDTIIEEVNGKYETLEQEHQNTQYNKQQIQQLKHFTDIQELLSKLLSDLKKVLRNYKNLDQQKEKDFRNSQLILQSKLSSSRLYSRSPKKNFQEPPPSFQMADSFSPTQYQKNKQQDIKQEEEKKILIDTKYI